MIVFRNNPNQSKLKKDFGRGIMMHPQQLAWESPSPLLPSAVTEVPEVASPHRDACTGGHVLRAGDTRSPESCRAQACAGPGPGAGHTRVNEIA